MEAEVTILVDSYNADFLKSLTHSALFARERLFTSMYPLVAYKIAGLFK